MLVPSDATYSPGMALNSPRVARVRVASRLWWRQAAAMEACPASFKAPMARFLSVEMTWGPLPARVWETSSP